VTGEVMGNNGKKVKEKILYSSRNAAGLLCLQAGPDGGRGVPSVLTASCQIFLAGSR